MLFIINLLVIYTPTINTHISETAVLIHPVLSLPVFFLYNT